jgi:hypothetical protein
MSQQSRDRSLPAREAAAGPRQRRRPRGAPAVAGVAPCRAGRPRSLARLIAQRDAAAGDAPPLARLKADVEARTRRAVYVGTPRAIGS